MTGRSDVPTAFPEELLDGSREAVRMAERIARRFVGEQESDRVGGLVERLTWAIAALEAPEARPGSGVRE